MWFVSFGLHLLLQALVAQFVVFFHTSYCFVYLTPLLLFPGRKKVSALLVIGFIVGLLVDTIYNTPGTHSFTSVLLVYSRSFWMPVVLFSDSFDKVVRLSLRSMGLKQFSFLTLPLIGLHHFALFLLDVGNPLFSAVVAHHLLLSIVLTYTAVLITQIPHALLSK